jgi:thioredoxin 2
MAGRLKLVKVNSDEAPQLSARVGIQAIPTLLLLRGEEVLARQTGAAPEHQLRNWLEQALPAAPSHPA